MTVQLAYSKAGAAESSGVSVQTINRAIKSGRLRAKRTSETKDGEPTGRVLIRAADLASWLDGLIDA